MTHLLRPDNHDHGYDALRSRLGFTAGSRRRMRLDLIGRRKVVRVEEEKPVVVIEAVPIGAPFNFLKQPGWKAIVTLVALKHGIGVKDILGWGRKVPIAQARHEAVYLVFTHCNKSLPETGKLFNRDHTTALNSVRIIKRMRGIPC